MNPDAAWSGGVAPGAHRFAVDGDYTVPKPISPARISYPFEGDSFAPEFQEGISGVFIYLPGAGNYGAVPQDPDPYHGQANAYWSCFFIEQDFEVAADFDEALDLNTPYDSVNYWPSYEGVRPIEKAILVSESPRSNGENGTVRFTRTYCYMAHVTDGLLPLRWDHGNFGRNSYESVTFAFPVISSTILLTSPNPQDGASDNLIPQDGRFNPLVIEVTSRKCEEFFLLDNSQNFLQLGISPQSNDPSGPFYSIPVFRAFVAQFSNEIGAVFDYQMLNDMGFNELVNGTPQTPTPTFTRANGSVPPKTTQAGEAGYYSPPDEEVGVTIVGNEICVKASAWERWRGNIYKRTTYFAEAQ